MVVSDWITIILAVAGAAAAFFGLKDFVRDKIDHLKGELHEQKIESTNAINQLKMENIRLSSKLQQVEEYMHLFNDQLMTQMRELKNGGGK